MFHKRLTGRLVPIGVCGAVIVAMAAPARSERLHDERACVTAFKKARGHEQSGRLQDAKELLMSCAQAPCGGFLRQQCSNKYNQLESDTPSVVLIVTDASGAPRADIQVRMDGEIFAPQLDGRALTVDPGMHEFSFSADGAVFATQKVMIVQGQRNRFITAVARGAAGGSGGSKQRRMVAQTAEKEVVTPASASAPSRRLSGTAKIALKEAAKDKDEEDSSASPPSQSEPGARGVASLSNAPVASEDGKSDDTVKKSGSVLPYIVGGLGLASIGGAAVLTYWGRKDNDNLGQCSPSCSPTATDHIKRLYLGADIALGVGVVALGAAYWIHVVTGREQEEKPTEPEALRFNVLPTPSGGFASVAGRF
jgi:hypothetical protein